MDIIPTFKLIGGLILFGMSFYFLKQMLSGLTSELSNMGLLSNSPYLTAMLWMFSMLPGVALLASGYRHLQDMQKGGVRRRGSCWKQYYWGSQDSCA